MEHKTTEWEEEWKIFLESGDPVIRISDVQADWVKSFISRLLESEREKERERILAGLPEITVGEVGDADENNYANGEAGMLIKIRKLLTKPNECMKSLTGKSLTMPPCPHCEKGEYQLCGHRSPMNTGIHLCPNCHGQKTVSKPPHIAGDQISWTASDNKLYPCPTCGGKGYIIIPTPYES